MKTKTLTTETQRHREIQIWILFSLCLCASVVRDFSSTAADTKKLTYDQDVLPILRDKCLSCHNGDKVKGGLDASSFAKLKEGGSSGDVIKAGDAENSRLYRLISHSEEPAMPPNSPKLAKASLDTIKAWIEQGALENAGSKATPVEKKAEVVKTITRARPEIPPMPTVELSKEPVMPSARPVAITALAASPWAPLVAVAGAKSVVLYNTDSLQLIGVLPFTHGQVNVLRFSQQGEVLLAAGGRGGHSGKAVVYDVKTGKIIHELADESDAILAADLSPDQSMIAVGGSGRAVRVYDVADGHKVRDIKKHTEWITAIEYSPDGMFLTTGDRNGGLHVWEAATGREANTLVGHRGAITDVAWRDDAVTLVSVSEDGTLKLWEMQQGRITRTAQVGNGPQSVRNARDNRMVSTGRSGKVKLLDPNGNPLREFAGLGDLGLRATLTHDAGRIVGGDLAGTVCVWEAKDGKVIGKLSAK